uniref:Uncharacterized protein n=1 Tax=Anguilla anguilla TaxID=7936 RepID=A0A0E9PDG3_ANGAN
MYGCTDVFMSVYFQHLCEHECVYVSVSLCMCVHVLCMRTCTRVNVSVRFQ